MKKYLKNNFLVIQLFLCAIGFNIALNINIASANPEDSIEIVSQSITPSNHYDFARPFKINPSVANTFKINPSVANKGKGQLQVSIKFPEEFPIISIGEGKSQRIQFAANHEYLLTNNPEKAPVPYYTINIVVPNDARGFRVSDIKTKEIQKTINQPLTIEKPKKSDRFSKKNREPSSPQKVQIIGTSQLRDITYLTLQVFPVNYNSSNQLITQTQGMQFDLSFQTRLSDNSVTVKDPENNIFHKIYQSRFLNYQWKKNDAPLKRNPREQGEYRILDDDNLIDGNYANNTSFWPDYLVIRSEKFITSASFNTWLNYRISEEGGAHNIAVASLEDIYSAYPGSDNPERIRDCIKFIYDNWGQSTNSADLIYLMFIGDADFGYEAQSWFMPIWDSSNTTTGIAGDNKYGCLEGEDGIPELLIGRIPVKDETELSTIINKTLSFENNPPQGENHYGTRNLFLGGSDTNTFGPTTNGARNVLIDHYQESDEFIATGSYNLNYPDFSFEDSDPAITNLINNNGYLTISYNGDDGTEEGWQPENINLNSLNNSSYMPALVISASSRTARFDWSEGDCFGESWIKKNNGGSVAFFGPTRKTFGMSYSADESILTGVYQNNFTVLGAAILEAKLDPSFSENDDLFRYNLLGDPAINIQNHLGISTKPEISFALNVETSAHPLNGDNVTLKSSIYNNGYGPAQGLNIDLSHIAYSGEITLVENIQITSPLNGGGSKTFGSNWIYEERFWDEFKFDTNEIDELSEFNNIYKESPYYIQYPMHFNPNNTTGIENGSYEHPFVKFKYTGPDYYHFGFDKIINNNRPGCVAKIYIYPGIYEGETSNCFNISNMKIIGEGDIDDIVIIKDSFNVSGYTSFENLTFQQVDTAVSSAPITIDGKTSSVQRCIFKDNLNAIACQNTWSWNGYETLANITNNIFFENNTAVYVADTEITTDLINNVIINNTEFLNVDSGDDLSNNLLIKNNIIRDNINNNLFPSDTQIINNYNNTDISYLLQTGSNNLDINPQFIDPINYNFHLLPTSLCINAGDPDPVYDDLDGSRNDMGAYGGPNSYAPIKITSPADGDVLFFPQGDPVTFDISWQTNNIVPEDSLRIFIYNIAPAAPDSGGGGKSFKKKSKALLRDNGQKQSARNGRTEIESTYLPGMTVFLNETVSNTGSFTVNPNILQNGQYFLRIYKIDNPSISDQISFEIENNRYHLKKDIKINYID